MFFYVSSHSVNCLKTFFQYQKSNSLVCFPLQENVNEPPGMTVSATWNDFVRFGHATDCNSGSLDVKFGGSH